MIELVNLSNTAGDLQYLLDGSPARLDILLQQHQLDGVEMMYAKPWDGVFPPKSCIKGVHLRFWPDWMDFYLNNGCILEETFPTEQALIYEYGTNSREQWLNLFRRNVQEAVSSGAPYFVFHVTNMRPDELVGRHFRLTDEQVIDTALDFINCFCDEIPADRLLLFENLWWAGLTLRNQQLARRLLTGVHHQKCGFMLDTGHLMATEPSIETEEEGIAFILRTLDNLGELVDYIHGIHLHCSLSGRTAMAYEQQGITFHTMTEALQYTLEIDQHQPFTSTQVRNIIEQVRPKVLVHEFVPADNDDWNRQISRQRQALGFA